ncbi:PhoX family protein [Segeticoccus rhizosphaerae]|jgi:secreted PhoX family phosphatase|uniref:PhoX family protein n=2 Tax=Segeticoccus rhizosphaerae TaxID=1104777 RepID=UPI0010BFC2EB|nr:alkaline phosphatase PhoX [Ornithinicoccus soli]
MTVERRTFLKAAAGGALLAGPFSGLVAGQALAAPRSAQRALRPIPDLRDGKVRLHLPAGFSYRSFHDTEQPVVLDDGTVLPGRHDGMGAFRGPGGNVVLIRNHEVNGPGPAFGPTTPYDPMAQGGTTTIEVSHTGEVVTARTSLSGTMMNCSGGIMPWGSWVTCEETVNGPDVGADFTGTPNTALTQPHGYLFEVPADGVSAAEPLTRAGRFAHEAVSFDPREGVLYLTEDNFGFPSGFYRYRPRRNPMQTGRLDNDGQLQMLAVKGEPNANLAASQRKRATYQAHWVDIDDPSPTFPYTPGAPAPTANDDAICYVGNQGRARGAALFSRLEGQVHEDGVIYFCSTQGGGAEESGPSDTVGGYGNGHGQVWAYDTRSERLQLLFESPGADVLDFPDNITSSRRGTLVVCEDNDDDNYLRGLSRGGQLSDIALNRVASANGRERYDDEFAGSTFSPDGRTLFVNIQASAGMTFAIWGPWHRIGV